MTRFPLLSDITLGLALLTRPERQRALLLLVSIMINGLLQTFALAGIIPFIQTLMDPTAAANSRWAAWLADYGVDLPSDRLLFSVGLCLLALVLIKNLYAWLQLRWQNQFSATCEQRLATFLLQRVLKAPYEWNIRQNSSVLREIILGHVVQWSRGFLRTSLQFANDLLFAAMAVALLIAASPEAGLVIFGGTAVIAWVLLRITRPVLLGLADEKRLANRQAGLLCTEAVAGVKDVKMTGSEALFTAVFNREFARYSFSDGNAQRWKAVPRLALEVLGYGSLIGTALVITAGGGDQTQAAAVLALYGIAAIRLLPIFSSAVSSINTLLDALPLLREIHQVIAETAVGEEVSAEAAAFNGWSEIRFEGVDYVYSAGEAPALHGIDLTIRRGECLGVVGPSGAGKSTLVDLLAMLLAPSNGNLTIDGRTADRSLWSIWRSHIGYVSQNPYILDASLRANTTFNQPETDAARLDAAIKAAHLDGVTAQLPEGLDTRLGERGVRLSGGQRQRVAIARALYRRADLLILDEATSALDSLSEREVTEAIRALVGSVTMVVIAHRLGTVRHCDRIVVLEHGRIIGTGPHQNLIETCPTYREMLRQSEPAASDAAAAPRI